MCREERNLVSQNACIVFHQHERNVGRVVVDIASFLENKKRISICENSPKTVCYKLNEETQPEMIIQVIQYYSMLQSVQCVMSIALEGNVS